MATISNKEAALLGLISEKPKHAYEIENDIKERDMRYWTEISMSSVYKLLNKLESRKLLESEVKLSRNNVAQKIYSITEQGKTTFKDKLKELVSIWQPSKHPIDIGLANLSLLTKKEAIEQLTKYLESLDKMLKCYTELEKFLVDSKCPLGNIQLATRRIHLLKAEKKWLRICFMIEIAMKIFVISDFQSSHSMEPEKKVYVLPSSNGISMDSTTHSGPFQPFSGILYPKETPFRCITKMLCVNVTRFHSPFTFLIPLIENLLKPRASLI